MIQTVRIVRTGLTMVVSRDWDGDAYAAALKLQDRTGIPRDFVEARRAAGELLKAAYTPVNISGCEKFFLIRTERGGSWGSSVKSSESSPTSAGGK